MPSSAPALPAVPASQTIASSRASSDSWEEPHPGLRRPYPPGTGLALVDRAAPGGCMDGMAAKRPRSHSRVRPWLPRRGAQHHIAGGREPPPPSINISQTNLGQSSSSPSGGTSDVSLTYDAAGPQAGSHLHVDVPRPNSNVAMESQQQLAASTEPSLLAFGDSCGLGAGGDAKTTPGSSYIEKSQPGTRTDMYGWDAELDRQIDLGHRPMIGRGAPCDCDLENTYRRAVGCKRSLLHRVFSLGSSTLDGAPSKVRRSASSSM